MLDAHHPRRCSRVVLEQQQRGAGIEVSLGDSRGKDHRRARGHCVALGARWKDGGYRTETRSEGAAG